MSRLLLFAILLCVPLATGGAWAWAADPTGKDLDAAVAKAHPLLEKVRAAAPASKEAKALLKQAFGCMAPYEKYVREHCYVLDGKPQKAAKPFARLWNDFVMAGRYHGVKRKGGYITDVVRAAGWRLLLDVPLSNSIDWEWKKSDQLQAEFTISLPDKKPRKILKLWIYEWDTTYSDVGGENASKLARVIFDGDKYFAKSQGRKSSPKVVTKRLNRHFTRAYHYWNEDFDKEHKTEVRHRHWYVKGKDVTYSFEVLDFGKWEASYDAYHTWLLESDGPLIAAILDSARPNEAYYKSKKK